MLGGGNSGAEHRPGRTSWCPAGTVRPGLTCTPPPLPPWAASHAPVARRPTTTSPDAFARVSRCPPCTCSRSRLRCAGPRRLSIRTDCRVSQPTTPESPGWGNIPGSHPARRSHDAVSPSPHRRARRSFAAPLLAFVVASTGLTAPAFAQAPKRPAKPAPAARRAGLLPGPLRLAEARAVGRRHGRGQRRRGGPVRRSRTRTPRPGTSPSIWPRRSAPASPSTRRSGP